MKLFILLAPKKRRTVAKYTSAVRQGRLGILLAVLLAGRRLAQRRQLEHAAYDQVLPSGISMLLHGGDCSTAATTPLWQPLTQAPTGRKV